jgi:hypothetical protein
MCQYWYVDFHFHTILFYHERPVFSTFF